MKYKFARTSNVPLIILTFFMTTMANKLLVRLVSSGNLPTTTTYGRLQEKDHCESVANSTFGPSKQRYTPIRETVLLFIAKMQYG